MSSLFRRIRFTLATLLSGVLLAASVAALVWDWAPWQLVLSIPSPRLSPVKDPVMMVRWPSQISDDGRWAVVFHDGQSATVWDMEAGRVQAELAGPVAINPPFANISPGGHWLASLDVWTSVVHLWDLRTGKVASKLNLGMEEGGSMSCLAFSPDETRIVTRLGNTMLRVWKVEDGSEACTYKLHPGDTDSVSWSADGKRLISTDGKGIAIIWSAATGDTERTLRIPEGIRGAEFLRRSSRLITRSETDSSTLLIKVWKDVADETSITGKGDHFSLSPDETRVAIFGVDNNAYIWDLSTGKPVIILSGNEGWVGNVDFSPDGRRAVTSDGNNPLRLWDLETGEILETWEFHRSATFLSNGDLVTQGDCVQRWHRRRPEPWWGIAWLPEFWLMVLLGIVFVRSLFRGNVEKRPTEAGGPSAMH